jgi:type IV secretion/conjugal transfer VirB4 family ATPase
MKLNPRTREQGFPDLVLYDAMIADGVLLLSDGSLLAGWRYRGPDMQSRTPQEMAALSAQLNGVLRLGGGWMIQVDLIRTAAPGYPGPGAFPDPVTAMIDEERRGQFMAEGAHYEAEYVMLVSYQPPIEAEERVRGWMFEGPGGGAGGAMRTLEFFEERIASIEGSLGRLLNIERLRGAADGDNLLRHVRRTIAGEDHPVGLPVVPACLQDVIGAVEFVGGIHPRVGGRHVRVLAIDGFPAFSYPGILRELDQLPVELRWHTRFLLLDPTEGEHQIKQVRKKWHSRTRGWMDVVLNRVGPLNQHAQKMTADAELAAGEASSGDVQFGYYASCVVLMDSDLSRVEAAASLVSKTVRGLGFACRMETVNAVEAFLGTLPGDGYRNVRRQLLHTLNLADMLPITSVWTGARENPSPLMPPHSPPLLVAATTGQTPFRFHLHAEGLSVGHTVLFGPTGAGKSTFLALIAAQWMRYPAARVIAFDKGHSLYALTSGTGGSFYDVGGPELSFCPLAHLDEPGEAEWAVEWVEDLCELQGLHVTPPTREAIVRGLALLAHSPSRTLTELVANIQNSDVREALRHYTIESPGSLGSLIDADHDNLHDGRMLCYEMGELMARGPAAVIPVLTYLFHRIERSLDGSPVLLIIDEAWVFLGHERFREKVRDWLKTMRKNNGAVLLATQNLSDIAGTPIADVIFGNCPTKVLLPGQMASPAAEAYLRAQLGLNDQEIRNLATALPRRDYYVISPTGRRMIQLGLGPVALSFTGAASREDRAAIRALAAHDPHCWPAAWLRSRNLPAWADYYEQMSKEEEEVCVATSSLY